MLTPQSSIDSYLPRSAAVKFHKLILYRPKTAHALQSFCIQARQTLSAMLSIATTLYISATHNITHSPCKSTCTTHPATPTTLPSTTLLCTQQAYLCKWQQNGTRCRNGVKVLWCLYHLVWLVFEGSIPTCTCFPSGNFIVTCLHGAKAWYWYWLKCSCIVGDFT